MVKIITKIQAIEVSHMEKTFKKHFRCNIREKALIYPGLVQIAWFGKYILFYCETIYFLETYIYLGYLGSYGYICLRLDPLEVRGRPAT